MTAEAVIDTPASVARRPQLLDVDDRPLLDAIARWRVDARGRSN